MANVNVSEADFAAVGAGAWAAKRAGDEEAAAALDKLARKINAALTYNNPTLTAIGRGGFQRQAVRWQDMPSVFDDGLTKDPRP